jgi:hypothetical protein
MSGYELNETLEHLRHELASTSVKAKDVTGRLNILRREAEYLKIHAFQYYVEEQGKSIARDRGIISLINDKIKVRNSLLMAAGSFVIGGLVTKDKFTALSAGMSGFDGMIQGFGEGKWCILLGKKISIVPEESIPTQVTRLPMLSFNEMMEEFKKRALDGGRTGKLDDVISRLARKT